MERMEWKGHLERPTAFSVRVAQTEWGVLMDFQLPFVGLTLIVTGSASVYFIVQDIISISKNGSIFIFFVNGRDSMTPKDA